MAEDLAIQGVNPQVQQKSIVPYVGLGAVGGAGLGYLGARYTTAPKYDSHQAIIRETKDNFEKAVKEVISDATLQEKAIDARQAMIDAKTEYKTKVAEYIESNKERLTKENINKRKLIEEYIEKNGTRKDYVKTTTESAQNDLKALMEKKIPNKKLALWMTGGAVVLAGLAAMLAPKNKA